MRGSVDDLYVRQLLSKGGAHAFYVSTRWRHIRKKAMQLHKGECLMCKAAGKYSPATTVHHVKHLLDRPDLALSLYDPETGEIQLMPLCEAHHAEVHGKNKWNDEKW